MEFANIRHVRIERRSRIAFEAYAPRSPTKGDESRWKFLGVFAAPLGTSIKEFSSYVRRQMDENKERTLAAALEEA